MTTIPYSDLTAEKIEALHITLWGEEDQEHLYAESADEAIETMLDALADEKFEGSITVLGYRRMKASFHERQAKTLLKRSSIHWMRSMAIQME